MLIHFYTSLHSLSTFTNLPESNNKFVNTIRTPEPGGRGGEEELEGLHILVGVEEGGDR